MAPQTRKSSARAAMKFLFDQLRPGLLGKIGDDTFLHARTERMPSRSFPCWHFHIPGETVDDLRLVEQSAIQSSTGVWRLPETWCTQLFQPASNTEQMVAENGPVAWFQRLGSFAKVGLFPPDLTNSAPGVDIETSPGLVQLGWQFVAIVFRRRTMRPWK